MADDSGAMLADLYGELRRLAQHYMAGERAGHTLQPTALVNEAYLRLLDNRSPIHDRTHLLAMAATMMRRILVDHARARGRDKRGGGATMVTLEDWAAATNAELDIIVLDDALTKFAALDPQAARVVELRFFTGLSVDETAAALNISPATVKRDWAAARAWLRHELTPSP
jgi:RNA polymerase sigma-70 factor (ECF subfamily)